MIANSDVAAVVLCGGQGTRIKEITKNNIPKALIKINGKPIIWYVVSALLKYGVKKIIFTVGF